jgi:pentatricopeptide repeat protein
LGARQWAEAEAVLAEGAAAGWWGCAGGVSACTFNPLLDAAGKAGHWPLAARVFASAQAAGVQMDAVSFSTMIHAAGASKPHHTTLELDGVSRVWEATGGG